jgi:hypothetical protein
MDQIKAANEKFRAIEARNDQLNEAHLPEPRARKGTRFSRAIDDHINEAQREAETMPVPGEFFDVSHHFDADFEGEVDNPFKGLSTYPGVMASFQRPDMEARLRVCIQAANKMHWNLPGGHWGENSHVDALTLRRPKPEEAKALKLSREAADYAREAAHIRAYLRQLDEQEAERKAEELAHKREYHKSRAARFKNEQVPWRKMIEENREAAARHEQRLKDEEAHSLVALAQKEIADLERKMARAQDELDRLDRCSETTPSPSD